jgi:hypothetical protein
MADQKWLSAAECAARTGLTVRTLHVYEREGLLSPPRSENGWRLYGPAELARLSAITSLKELGLTAPPERGLGAAACRGGARDGAAGQSGQPTDFESNPVPG